MKYELEGAITELVKTLFGVQSAVILTRPEEQFGDYSTNVALQLGKQLGKNPSEIGQQLVGEILERFGDKLSDVRLAGPGFINLTLNDSSLLQGTLARPAESLKEQTILAEYSDPNPFKPLHAGHLYTTLVGDAVARLLEIAGSKVIRINFGGDVGLHVGKSMWAILQSLGEDKLAALAAIPEAERPGWLGARYVEGNRAYEDDETAREAIIAVNRQVYDLHETGERDSEFAQIYWICRDWSYSYFSQLYTRLGVKPFDRVIPESEIAPLGLAAVREQLERGVYSLSDGAVVFKGEEYGLHTRVFITAQGLPTYEAKDVGLLLTKWRDYHFDRSLVITANEQVQYMEVMLKSVELFEPEAVKRSEHLTHGTVKLHGGVKMSSRTGNVVGALDILEAASAANKTATGKDDEGTVTGAVKYSFLKNRIGGDIIYDPEESVSLEGNSGPYLQYAHARAKSIIRKGDTTSSSELLLPNGGLLPPERSLVRKIGAFAEVVDQAVTELMPHYICTYLYDLAQCFNRFYEQSRVLGDERESFRLGLVGRYADMLARGLELLGIDAPDQM